MREILSVVCELVKIQTELLQDRSFVIVCVCIAKEMFLFPVEFSDLYLSLPQSRRVTTLEATIMEAQA